MTGDRHTIIFGKYDDETGDFTPYPEEEQAERLATLRAALRRGDVAIADAQELGVPLELIESWLAGRDSD